MSPLTFVQSNEYLKADFVCYLGLCPNVIYKKSKTINKQIL